MRYLIMAFGLALFTGCGDDTTTTGDSGNTGDSGTTGDSGAFMIVIDADRSLV